MCYGESFKILGLDWANIHFVENPGMAFGFEFGEGIGKLALSLFRLCAFGFLVWYIRSLVLRKAPVSVLISFALILAGAIGNIIDSAFYGVVFSESSYHCISPATLFPAEGGYGTFLHGKVVDMLYFPIHEFQLPNWVPRFGGGRFMFFAPVFNIADASITAGVTSLIFNRSFFFDANEIEGTEATSEFAIASETTKRQQTEGDRNDNDASIKPETDETNLPV